MISIIIPVFNGEKYLDQCLSSINATDIEIIVVNDASDDNSEQIARKYTDHVINIPHSGPVIARNIGIKNAHGEYIIFMDADDVLKENAIDIMQKGIIDFDLIIGRRQDFISPDCNDIIVEQKTSSHGVIAGCAIFKKSVFEKVGFFDEELLCGDAYDWLLRARKNNLKIKEIDDILCMRRIHNNNMGRTMGNREKSDYAKIIRKHFVGK